MNNINDMTDKQLNKTPWSETKMKKYGLTNREYKGRKIIFEDEIISVLKKEYDDDFPPNIIYEYRERYMDINFIQEVYRNITKTYV